MLLRSWTIQAKREKNIVHTSYYIFKAKFSQDILVKNVDHQKLYIYKPIQAKITKYSTYLKQNAGKTPMHKFHMSQPIRAQLKTL